MQTDASLQTNEETAAPAALQSYYNDAARQLVQDKLIPEAVIDNLVARGASMEQAGDIVYGLQEQIITARKKRAQKDMLYGGLWCAGGTILTIANTGFIFWGAIIFGGIQFFRGVANSSGD